MISFQRVEAIYIFQHNAIFTNNATDNNLTMNHISHVEINIILNVQKTMLIGTYRYMHIQKRKQKRAHPL